jgi:hypothetical protein
MDDMRIWLLLFLVVIPFKTVGQIDCNEYFKKDSTNDSFSGYSEGTPKLLSSYGQLYLTIDSSQSGKIFIRVVIDIQGKPKCSRVVRSDNESLNDRAIKLVEGLSFTPAKQRGKAVASTLVLSIGFGGQKPPDRN